MQIPWKVSCRSVWGLVLGLGLIAGVCGYLWANRLVREIKYELGTEVTAVCEDAVVVATPAEVTTAAPVDTALCAGTNPTCVVLPSELVCLADKTLECEWLGHSTTVDTALCTGTNPTCVDLPSELVCLADKTLACEWSGSSTTDTNVIGLLSAAVPKQPASLMVLVSSMLAAGVTYLA